MAILAGVVAGGLLLARWRSAATVIVVGCVLAEVFFHSPRWYPRIAEKTAYPRVASASLARQRGGRMVLCGVNPFCAASVP